MDEFVRDAKRFAELETECGQVVDKSKRFPEYVFKVAFTQHYAIEYGWLVRESFADVLLGLSTAYQDNVITYLSIEPDAYEYYYKSVGFFGMACFEPKTIKLRYMDVMLRGGEPDSFFARGGDVGVFFGSSMRWAIFCDRISWELAVLGVFGSLPHDIENSLPSLDAIRLKSYINSQYTHLPEQASQSIQNFMTNYRIGNEIE